MATLNIRLTTFLVICLGLAGNGFSQGFDWLSETAYGGLFTWENCKQVRRISFDDRYLNRKKWENNKRLSEGDVEFDTLGRPIRSSYKSWDLFPELVPSVTRYVYADTQVTTYLTQQYWDGSLKEGEGETWFAHDGCIDSLFREQKFIQTTTRSATRIVRTPAGRVSQVINWSSSQQPNREPRIKCDTATYTYDAAGRVASYHCNQVDWQYEYLRQDSLVIRGNAYYEMDLAVKLNPEGLPTMMTAMQRRSKRARQREISRVYFYYQMR